MVGGSLRVLPASSTTKTGPHDIAEILLKVALSTINQIKSEYRITRLVRRLFLVFFRHLVVVFGLFDSAE